VESADESIRSFDDVIAEYPAVLPVPEEVLAEFVGRGKKVIVLDDDPTGTQTVADVPVLTAWTLDDVRWALRQPTAGFFILTNSRSLSPADASSRTSEVARVCAQAAALEGVEYVFASRSDSTLRGHFPLETDVLIAESALSGAQVDGVIVVPAYVDAGRITIGSVQWLRTADSLLPAAASEFARDATFGYRHSDLREWVEEKTDGRVAASEVHAITLTDLRGGGVEHVSGLLDELRGGRVAVVDAADDSDLRILVLAILQAERRGRRFVYRIGPSFVRARLGQAASIPKAGAALADLLDRMHGETPAGVPNGLVVVGSHTALTTRQLNGLRESRLRTGVPLVEVEVDVALLRDANRAEAHRAEVIGRAVAALQTGTVAISTSRMLVTGSDGDESLAIARLVSAAIVDVVKGIRARVQPAFVVAKGGITSSDVATAGLGITRSIARGTLLPGIVSLWEPLDGPAAGIPYVVFAGNVGGDDSLSAVVSALSAASALPVAGSPTVADDATALTVAVVGLGAMGLPMATRLGERFEVTAFDPAEDRLAQAEARGIRRAATPAEASRDADVVLFAVRDRAQLEAALFAEGGAVEGLGLGSVVVVTSTIGPDAVRELGARLAAHGILVVDAPISGGPVRAGLGDLLVVVGANEEALTVARPVLDQLASTLTIVGPSIGDGQVLKTINQLLAGVHIAAAAEALALARALGVDPELVVSALSEGAAGSFMFADRGPRMVDAYRGGAEVKSRLDIFVKDMGIVTAVSADAKVPTPLAAAAQQLYLIAERAGLGAADDSSVITVLSPID
jgi:3-hydroxyisobutyrate dehydrogenase-like beta-hydroxyacid dehydrogenase/uncharacterized protein YgbK (DUF1537 family)